MDKKLKSVELFLALGLAATVNVTATQAAEINQETNNHNNLHMSNELTTPNFLAEGGEGGEGGEGATMDHGQDHSTEEGVGECPGGVNVNTGECLPTDEGGEGGEGGEGATMDHGQDHSTEEGVGECPGGVNVNTGECLPTDEGAEGGEGGEGGEGQK